MLAQRKDAATIDLPASRRIVLRNHSVPNRLDLNAVKKVA
jgi:hypothetical protein